MYPFWLMLFAGVISFHEISKAQLPEFNFKEREDAPNFYYDVVTYADQDTSKSVLSISIKIVYDELQFVRTDTGYQASYELSATVFDRMGHHADSKILKTVVELNDFKKTNSRKDYSLSQIQFILVPGNYELLLGVMDFDSKVTSHRKTKVQLPNYRSDQMMISDLSTPFDQKKKSSCTGRVASNAIRSAQTAFLHLLAMLFLARR